MKKWMILFLICVLAFCMPPAAFAEESKVTQLEPGWENIFMSNGYFAYDVQHLWESGGTGYGFTVVDTDDLITKDDVIGGSKLHNSDGVLLLKHFLVNHYDKAFQSSAYTQQAAWWYTSSADGIFLSVRQEIQALLEADIAANTIASLPDRGTSKQIDENTVAFFDFIGLIADKNPKYDENSTNQVNNLLGYKIRYEVTGEAGGSAVLSVPPLFASENHSRQWQMKKGDAYVPISGETGASLTLSPLSRKHDGQAYRCVVNKDTGAYFDYTVIVENTESLPQTGDSSCLVLWACLFPLCAAGFVLLRRRSTCA